MQDERETTLTRSGHAQALAEGARANPFLIYLSSLASPKSRRTQASGLGHVCREVWGCEPECLTWGALGLAELTALRSWMVAPQPNGRPRYAPATANRILSGFRRVLFYARRLGQMSEGAYQSTLDVKRVRGSRLVPGRAVTAGELRALFSIFDARKPLDARNAALLALLYGAGLRREEACGLDLADLDLDAGSIIIRGKGQKERRGFLPQGAQAAMRAWLRHRGEEPGPLLYATDHGRELTRRRLSVETVSHTVGIIGQRAGVFRFSPHDLRRTYCSDLLESGADTTTVQKLMGHSSPTTTSAYDRRPDLKRAAAVDLLCVPFLEKASNE